MKKALVVFLLAIFMATGAFAQTTADAQVHMDFALATQFGTVPGTGPAPEDVERFAFTDSSWNFNYLTSGTWLRVRHTGENARGWLQFRANGHWRGVGSATAGIVDFEIHLTIDELKNLALKIAEDYLQARDFPPKSKDVLDYK